jgi:hypothetical protein
VAVRATTELGSEPHPATPAGRGVEASRAHAQQTVARAATLSGPSREPGAHATLHDRVDAMGVGAAETHEVDMIMQAAPAHD